MAVIYPGGAGITDKTAANLLSAGMKFVGTHPTVADPWETDYEDIRDAVLSEHITSNLTLYVDIGAGSDVTGTGAVGAPWQTISHALSEVQNYRITPGIIVTLELADGVYTETASIDNTPTGLKIAGENTHSKSMTSVQSSSGSAGAWAVIINLDSVADITTDDYVIIHTASSGTLPHYITGFWEVTNVDSGNTRITVASTHENATAPSGAVAATVIVIKANIQFNGVTGIDDANCILEDVGIHGNNTASTYGIRSSACKIELSTVGIRYFGSHGISASIAGNISASTLAISSNGASGIVAIDNSTLALTTTVITGNTTRGIDCQGGSTVSVIAVVISGNDTIGILCQFNGTIWATAANIVGNNSWGVQCLANGLINVGSSVVTGTNAVYAGSYGYVNAVSATLTGNVSPAVNTQGNEYGYINT